MKASKLMIAGLVSMMMLAACAKKDDSFKARYANGNGANSGNSANAAIADQAVDSAGIMVDILSLHTVSVSPMTFKANVLVGNNSAEATMQLNSIGVPVQAQTMIGAYTVVVTAQCANANCDPAYFEADAYLNGVAKIQTGYKFRRLLPDASSDRYTRFAAPFKSFADMITYLDSLN
jgi:hypothetical protein